MEKHTGNTDNYEKLGASSGKSEVHKAVTVIDPGLFPGAFCRFHPERDEEYCKCLHVDGDGTKTAQSYVMWKETDDLKIWEYAAKDALEMNIGDVMCAGVSTEPILYALVLDRNKLLIPDKVIETLIRSTNESVKFLNSKGMNIYYAGGETADVGDTVRTISINAALSVSILRKNVIVPRIEAEDVIVGFASFGKATYESEYNCGISTNGLTLARHGLFKDYVGQRYPDSFNPHIEHPYFGKFTLKQRIEIGKTEGGKRKLELTGKAILHPARTYAPLLLKIFEQIPREKIKALIHNTGGGQTKVTKFLNDNLKVVKDNLFPTPPIFTHIQNSSKTSPKEMYKVFNMGHRLELYTDKETAEAIIKIAEGFDVGARIVGKVKRRTNVHPLIIVSEGKRYSYTPEDLR